MASSVSDLISTHIYNGITELRLNRPEKHNALNYSLIEAITASLKSLENNPATKVIIIAGNGANFCAGGDLKEMQSMVDYSEKENIADAKHLGNCFATLDTLKKPTIAMVHGGSYGGALGLISCCDIAFAATDASFCMPEVKLGLIPALISPYVIRAIGARQARRYFVSGELFSAETALQINLVHEVFAPENLEEETLEFAKHLLKNGPVAMQQAKQLVHDQPEPKDTAKLLAKARVSSEAQQRLRDFLKR